ncbi:hypothetical protein VB620_13795 [Nodularia harveyana UHCC-0300]|uniref:Glutamine synthetase inactivating factor IF7 n=1 Tax=Nodularia harveyana UHCC-0300 TaxID=2974287 RepID=A0ABU5UFX0_9CYAN|nr:hypothetical protein [Nodularia harveyana]MEA5582409.1 hypothetical protein [Nodularia harveyana UHCC-0300]
MSIQDRIRGLTMHQYQQVKNRQQSMLMRAAQELGLPEELSQYWSPTQGKIDPTIRLIYETSHASMS